MQSNDEKFVQTTPKWAEVLPLLLFIQRDGTEEGRAAAFHQFTLMANLADHANDCRRKLQQLVDAFPQFDSDEDVNGSDAVDFLGRFREEVKALLSTPLEPDESPA